MILKNYSRALLIAIAATALLSGCTTQNGRYGAGVGALTGGTAGILLDPHTTLGVAPQLVVLSADFWVEH